MDVLKIKMDGNDADAQTIGEYFKALLSAIWHEGESFSGKRPFGNSGWEYELYYPLVKAGAIKGEIDEGGDLISVDEEAARDLISKTIEAIQF